MTDRNDQPPLRPVPRYGFGKRLKTASVSALVTSVFWIVFMVLYWPRSEAANPPPVLPGAAQAGSGSRAATAPQRGAGVARLYDGPAVYVAPREGLKMPVQSVAANQLADNYTQSRGDGSRAHNAIDILAPRGTPVLAAASGTVAKLFASKNGGNTVYERSPDGKAIYYYAHLDSYAPGLTDGMPVTPGQVLGFVGSTGDADPAAPHLHFAIMVLAAGETWWQGRPINPYRYLGGR
ncbi:M23 family metallopeptidase [Novosphingobium sp.]|uniref:M23 family metallopeptidase n=1 Tax=Novosphingobium sp. TaxID=1874826 RepID=UPI0025EA8DE4|nr:M23 family metallopeptidase [Novosphingobium sp.]